MQNPRSLSDELCPLRSNRTSKSDRHLGFLSSPHDLPRDLRTAFLLNFGFTIVELVGGILTNSVAIISDALHDLGDSFSLGLGWWLETYSAKGEDDRYSYGYRRFSLLAALINATILISGALLVLSIAIPRLLHPAELSAFPMVLVSLVGVVVNTAAVLRVKKHDKPNAKILAFHLLEDALGWVTVLIMSVILLFTDLYILDPILSILISVYILFSTAKVLRSTVALFLQAVPGSFDLANLEREFIHIEGVVSAHHTHLWSLDGENHILTTHLVVGNDSSRDELIRIKDRVRDSAERLNLDHITVELEFEEEECKLRESGH